MTPAAAADIVDATWNGWALTPCRDCHYNVGRCRLLNDAHADPFDCPAVEIELDKECAE